MGRRRYLLLLLIAAITAAANALAWENQAFCDFYVLHIYPFSINTLGRLTGLFSFSVGEVMIAAGLAAAAAAVLLGFSAVIFFLFFKKTSAYPRVAAISKKYYIGLAWVMTGLFVIMTLNCFIPYHSSTLADKSKLMTKEAAVDDHDQMIETLLEREYTLEELAQLRDYVVIKSNQLSLQVERDEEGRILYPENIGELAAQSMNTLAGDCPQLAGYYPAPKPIHFSGFLSQQHMKGYFFPFSMEVNYNGMMHPLNVPATVCHEYAHLKGYMFEDEANMLGFLACINSDNQVFQYSGYISILNYVNNEFYKAVGSDKSLYSAHVKISPLVRAENIFLEEEAWKSVEEKAVISTEVVGKVSDKISETSMVFNGVEDGMQSYTRVVGLLLNYYDGSEEIQQVLSSPEYLSIHATPDRQDNGQNPIFQYKSKLPPTVTAETVIP